MTITQRISEWIPARSDGQGLNLKILPYEQRSDKDMWFIGDDKIIWRVKDVFSVWQAFGGWTPNPAVKWTIPQWAHDDYLKPPNHPNFCDPGGGDHHIITSSLNVDGSFSQNNDIILYWWYDALTSPVSNTPKDKYAYQTLDAKGWDDMLMAGSGGSYYTPATGQMGPYKVTHFGASDIIYGFGMPNNEHLSFVVVFQAEFQTGELHGPVEEVLRNEAWKELGIPYNPEAAFAKWARNNGAGMPMTVEFDRFIDGKTYRCQAFNRAILFCEVGDWGNIKVLPW